MKLLPAVQWLFAVPAVVSLGYFPVAAFLLRRWLREQTDPIAAGPLEAPMPPVTFFRPLKAGVPDLSAKLTVLAQALHPQDQLLVGAVPDSAEWSAAENLRRAFPERDIVAVPCAAHGAAALNPKMAKLLQMEPCARHDHWILSDSEAVTDTVFLQAFRREWFGCDVLTAGYRFGHSSTCPQQLDAAAVLLTLWPGLAVLRAFRGDRLHLTLGACSGFRRSDLQAVGGWAAFADDLAEDNRLGQELAAAGRSIRLSTQVVSLESDPLSWRDYWRHQRRVAVTYRVANPSGFAGTFFTQGVTTSFLLALTQPMNRGVWLGFAALLLVRCLTAWRAARTLQFSIPYFLPVIFLASLVETVCWALSWLTRRVWWSGRLRPISSSGRLLPAGNGE